MWLFDMIRRIPVPLAKTLKTVAMCATVLGAMITTVVDVPLKEASVREFVEECKNHNGL